MNNLRTFYFTMNRQNVFQYELNNLPLNFCQPQKFDIGKVHLNWIPYTQGNNHVSFHVVF